MASKVKINNGKIMDGSKTVGMIKNGCIYDRNIASSSYILAMTKNNVRVDNLRSVKKHIKLLKY